VETLFVPTAPQVGHLSSSLVKQIAASAATSRGWCRRVVLDRLLAPTGRASRSP
jgi:pantetheine-phosphate adenylyltransferase